MSRFDNLKRSNSFPVQGQCGGPGPYGKSAIVVFAKAPIPGQVKTRLCPPLTPDEAATLQGCFVMDMLERCRTVKGCDIILAGTPSSRHPFFKALESRHRVKLWEQTGEDLGSRLSGVFQIGLGSPCHYHSLVVVGTDIPGISSRLLVEALEALHEKDVVIGPTRDGGYYLIGLRKFLPELFDDIPWSTDRVFSLTEQKIHFLGLSKKVLSVLRDVDTVRDLQAITQEFRGAGRDLISQRSTKVLLELEQRLKAREKNKEGGP